jgi:hypothetical protein
MIPVARAGGYGAELARFAAANRSLKRHRRKRWWLRLRASVLGRRKPGSVRSAPVGVCGPDFLLRGMGSGVSR